jgi:GT2 family glycosyltransferase
MGTLTMREMPLVSIIVVNHNGKKFLKMCFDSLFNLNYPEGKLEIIMVDNCSQDDSVDYVRKNYPNIKIIKNDINNYCRANNLGIKRAKGEYVALINNDLEVENNWLIELIKVIEADKTIGAVTSKVLFPDGKLQSTGHYQFPNFYWSDRGFKEVDKGQYNKVEEVFSISHCAALYRKECLNDVGLLDEDFNMYMEDVDMSIRINKKGWRLFYIPESIAYHKFHGSIDDALVDFYSERNRLLLVAKHYPDKLSEALFGKGYWTALNKKDLMEILPFVFVKLIKHNEKERVISLLQDIFEGLSKILNLEKDYLIKQNYLLQELISQKEQHLTQKDEQLIQKSQQLVQKDQILQQRDTEIGRLKEEISQHLNSLSQKDHWLAQKDEQLIQKDQQLIQKDQILQQRDTEINNLNNKINQIYNSQTYRFIARPIWKVLDIIKRVNFNSKTYRKKRWLVIKPSCVEVRDVEIALSNFRKLNPNVNISLIANLLENEHVRLSNNKNIDEKIFYNPNCKNLNSIELLKLFFKIRRKKFDEAILLIGKPFYHGYRKGKLLAAFSGSKKIKYYFIDTENFATPNLFTFLGITWKCIYSNLLLFIILISFFIFIIFPLKLKKFFRR